MVLQALYGVPALMQDCRMRITPQHTAGMILTPRRMPPLEEHDLNPLEGISGEEVRDIYEGDKCLLLVSSNRVHRPMMGSYGSVQNSMSETPVVLSGEQAKEFRETHPDNYIAFFEKWFGHLFGDFQDIQVEEMKDEFIIKKWFHRLSKDFANMLEGAKNEFIKNLFYTRDSLEQVAVDSATEVIFR